MSQDSPAPATPAELADTALRRLLEIADGADAPTRLAVLRRVRNRVDEELVALAGLEERVRRHTGRITSVDDDTQLARLHHTLNDLAVQLFQSDHSVTELMALCTAYRDQLFVRSVQLTEAEMGPPPCAYAVGSMGSEGRGEQTLHTDQDNMIVYQVAEGREYFQHFGRRVNERLDSAGLRRCSGGIMMGEPAWQGTLEDWQKRIDDTFAFRGADADHRKQLLDLMILSDLRFIHGNRALLQRLTSTFFGRMHENVPVLYDMATACVSMPIGIGLFGKFKTDRSGPNRGRFNVKLLGWAPLILAVRVLALKENVYETNTLQRIDALRVHHRIDDAFAADLSEAYRLLSRQKIEAQIRGPADDGHDLYHIDPEELGANTRDAMKRSLHTVEALQKIAYHSFQLA